MITYATRMWIDGQGTQGDAEPRQILDPARNAVIAEVKEATPSDVDRAVRSAQRAFERGDWRRQTPRQRGDALLALSARMREHAEELAQIDSLNVGKPITQARGDAAQAADFIDYFGRVIIDLPGEVIQNDEEQMTLVVREPTGVVAAVVPWNFPVVVAAASIGPALAAGNSVVLKPSSITPLTALRLGELTDGILPRGVLNVVTGSGDAVGDVLVTHPLVDRVAFTGSTGVGQAILQKSAASMKRVGLELGGKSPTLILDDAPFDDAVQSALARIALNQGENCAAGSRLLVSASMYDRFVDALGQKARELVIGDPQRERTDLGPMVSVSHKERVESYMALAANEARPLYIGDTPQRAPFSSGFYVPVSLWDAGPGTGLWREEVFGPMLAITSYQSEEEMVRLANDTDFGLLATVWCGDRGRGLRVARQLRTGIVRINNATSPINGPWGGFKMSGIGRGYGRYAIEEATELKQINIDLR